MSKIRKSSPMIPTASIYVRNAIRRIGRLTYSTPYPYHNWMRWVLENWVPKSILLKKTLGKADHLNLFYRFRL
jgi:hypothetical protein